MSMKCIGVVLALMMGWPLAAESRTLNSRETESSIARKVQTLVDADDYAALDRLAASYRSPGALTDNGESSLMYFYQTLSFRYLSIDEHDAAQWDARIKWAQRWVDLQPKSATAHVVLARAWYNRGMSYRGEVSSREVPAANWDPYREYVGKAADHLLANRPVAARDPYYYSIMQHAAFRLKRPDLVESRFFDEGASRYPYFFGLFSVSAFYRMPSYGGSFQAIDSFARHAMTHVPTKDRDVLYLRIYEDLLVNAGFHPFGTATFDWAIASRGIDRVVAQYPSQRNLERFAYFTCMANDGVRTARLMKQLHGAPDFNIWGSEVVYEYCQQMPAGADQ
ncbi:DUF4034 domain-containing protein [Stenotrophomonas sp.]|uniref:DUF4034 domain-containing protein n=1 Tax=Stenotrophomonas sp. TaxID=69392 RepID=UPI00289B9DAB|nr:DUF4034 domain-containing protein [Stenotrophomonas sp.]